MAIVSAQECRLLVVNCHVIRVPMRSWSSAGARRSTAPRYRPVHPSSVTTPTPTTHTNSDTTPNGTLPNLCLGARGKAPGFVQQMLFQPPAQAQNAKGMVYTLMD
jgi:hypothetical protein